jgi:hypothetical protein
MAVPSIVHTRRPPLLAGRLRNTQHLFSQASNEGAIGGDRKQQIGHFADVGNNPRRFGE